MTVMAITLGLAPIMWSHGTGAEVMKRIATPMVGGMVSATLLTLIVVPAILAFIGWTAMRARLGSERHVLDVHERLPGGGRGVRGAVGAGAIVLAVAAAVIWAGYGFEAAPLAREAKLPRNQALSAMLASNPAALRAYRFVAEDVPFPAPSFFRGLDRVRKHARHGHDAFLDGERSADGWWRYFPMAFWMKTSLPLLLLLAAVAATWWLGRPVDEHGAEALLVCGAVTFFLVAMASGINIGIRHVLPVYPILCVLVGRLATVRLPRAAVAACLGALLGWHGVEAIRTCPDHLAYFQPLAGGPDRGYTRLVDSNLDWGQDLRGLARDLKERGQRRLWLTYFGPIDPAYYGIEHEPLPPGKPVTGFVAISATALQLGIDGRSRRPAHDDPYGWLRAHEPMDSIGHSILIYVIPER